MYSCVSNKPKVKHHITSARTSIHTHDLSIFYEAKQACLKREEEKWLFCVCVGLYEGSPTFWKASPAFHSFASFFVHKASLSLLFPFHTISVSLVWWWWSLFNSHIFWRREATLFSLLSSLTSSTWTILTVKTFQWERESPLGKYYSQMYVCINKEQDNAFTIQNL